MTRNDDDGTMLTMMTMVMMITIMTSERLYVNCRQSERSSEPTGIRAWSGWLERGPPSSP